VVILTHIVEVISVSKVEENNCLVRKSSLVAVLIALFVITFSGCTMQTKKQILQTNELSKVQTKKITPAQTKRLKLEQERKILAINTFMNAAAKKGFSGSVLVALNGKVILAKGYGMADKEKNYPAQKKLDLCLPL
jgi:hypothetical protein